MRLDWNDPVGSANNVTKMQYIVRYRKFGDSVWNNSKAITDGETHYVATGLAADKSYEFMVFGYNGTEESLPTDPIDTSQCPAKQSKYA